MQWSMVEIEDLQGKKHKGSAAMDFVLEHIDGTVIVKPFSGDKFALSFNRKNFVSPDDVHRLLSDKLAGKYKTLTVEGIVTPPKSNFVPNVAIQNPINVVPEYTITFELGDIDALFEPIINEGEPWQDKGVQQRLQVLGYLYTPLEHPGNKAPDFNHAKACWYYYMQAHKLEEFPTAVNRLKEEVEGNLIAAKFPKSGEILPKSKLPVAGKLAAIRFPGGYGTTKSAGTELRAGDHYFNESKLSAVDTKYDFGIGDPRDLIEKVVFEENPLLGKIPLIAKVMKQYPGEEPEPAPEVPVLFQLAMADTLPADSPFAAPELPHKVMNYSQPGKLWKHEEFVPDKYITNFTRSEWKGIHRLTKSAYTEDPDKAVATATTWIEGWLKVPVLLVEWDSVKDWAEEAKKPYPRITEDVEDVIKKWVAAKIEKPDTKKPAAIAAVDQWNAIAQIAKNALEKSGDDKMAAATLASSWIETWNNSLAYAPENVPKWWGDVNDKPYSTLKLTKKNKALEAMKFLLDDPKIPFDAEISDIGQKKFVAELMAKIISERDVADPQRANAPESAGGKAGAGIEKVLEKPKAQQAGFHTKRPAQTSDYGTLNLAGLPADAGKNPHAMECKTNEKGFAGVLFMPSQCGGDTYKLRAYIDPDWIKERAPAVVHTSVAETGTMVVWRNVRLNSHLRLQTTPMKLSTELAEILKDEVRNSKFKDMALDTGLSNVLMNPGTGGKDGPYPPDRVKDLNGLSQLFYRPIAVNGTPFETHFRRGYCELIADEDSSKAISEQELKAAIVLGRKAFDSSGKLDKRIKWDKLQLVDPTSPFLLFFRGREQYNSLLTLEEKETYKPLDSGDESKLKAGLMFFYEGMSEYFADGGVVPGLTLIQIPRSLSWEATVWGFGGCESPITSGYGTASRAAYLSWTDGEYKKSFHIYPATSNALHEIGHVLGLCHELMLPLKDGAGAAGSIAAAHQKAITEPYKKPAEDECVCVMSYTGCYGDFCGKCLLSLRGWKTHSKGDL